MRFEQIHLLGQQLGIQVEAHGGDVSTLGRAEQIARAANLQVLHGDAQPGAELGRLEDRLEPFLSDLAEAHVSGVQEIRVRSGRAAAARFWPGAPCAAGAGGSCTA